jgi:DNA-directed RNA polymerase specialized sigma24 family protein
MASLLSNLSAQQLRKAASIRERIEQLEKQLESILGAGPSAPKPARKPAPKRRAKKRAKHGQVKNAILNLLKQSGKKGITVKEIAVKVGLPVQRIHTWFYNGRKSFKQIKKTGPGKYLWEE